jgi:hypothetical protein
VERPQVAEVIWLEDDRCDRRAEPGGGRHGKGSPQLGVRRRAGCINQC